MALMSSTKDRAKDLSASRRHGAEHTSGPPAYRPVDQDQESNTEAASSRAGPPSDRDSASPMH
jgi:hypothetical protein